jgi:hypothetical protein
MKRIWVILIALIAGRLFAVDSTSVRIRLPGSGYSAIIVGQAGYQCAGDTAAGAYNSTFQAHEFYVKNYGSYKLWWDPAGGTSYVEVTDWSGTLGKIIPAPDIQNLFDFWIASDLNSDGIVDTLGTVQQVLIKAGSPYEYLNLQPQHSQILGNNMVWAYYSGGLVDTTAQIVSTSSQILNMFKTLDLKGKMTFWNETNGDSAGYIEVHDTYGKALINLLLHSATFSGHVPAGSYHGPVWTIYNDTDGNQGMYFQTGKESASPAGGDTLAIWSVNGKDDAANTDRMFRWVFLQGTVADGSESAYWKQETKYGGVWVTYAQTNASGIVQNHYKDQTRMTWTLGETFSAPGPFLAFIDGDDASDRLFKFDADSSRHPNWSPVIVEDAGSAGDTVDVILKGYVPGWSGLSVGHKVWASRTADHITTAPDTNYVMQYIGRALSATEIWFEPAGNWSEK